MATDRANTDLALAVAVATALTLSRSHSPSSTPCHPRVLSRRYLARGGLGSYTTSLQPRSRSLTVTVTLTLTLTSLLGLAQGLSPKS